MVKGSVGLILSICSAGRHKRIENPFSFRGEERKLFYLDILFSAFLASTRSTCSAGFSKRKIMGLEHKSKEWLNPSFLEKKNKLWEKDFFSITFSHVW